MVRISWGSRLGRFRGTATRERIRKRRGFGWDFFRGVESLEARALLTTVTVHVVDFAFSPSTLTIQPGDTVHWVWDGDMHSTTSVAGSKESWDSGVHMTGFTFDHTFTQAGSFSYFCTIHGFDKGNGTAGGMSGVVTVSAATNATLKSITITPANPSIAVGASQQLTATGVFSDSSTQNLTGMVTWASATPAVATVTSTGTATGQAAGTSTVTASLNGVTGSTVLTVTGTSTEPAPVLTGEHRVFSGMGRRRKLVAFELDFNTPLLPNVATDVSRYKVVQPGRNRRSPPTNVPVITATYNSTQDSVTLVLGRFKANKPLTLTAQGLLGATGTPAAPIVTKL